MSRTLKDRPSKLAFSENSTYRKIARKASCPWKWLQSTPSWWNRLFHSRPRRREAHMWERSVVKTGIDGPLEDLDIPNVTNKPHKYYW